MLQRFLIIVCLFSQKYVKTEIAGHIVGGDFAMITLYPHSVFLFIHVANTYMCGGSIVNQVMILTAAHCFEMYKTKNSNVEIKYGSTELSKCLIVSMKRVRVHENYHEFKMTCDIALVLTKSRLKLGNTAKRIAIMKMPPSEKYAYISGWGATEIGDGQPSQKLQHVKQEIQPRRNCAKLGIVPENTFCAGPVKGPGRPAFGDSGSALIVDNYIQIGIVSFTSLNNTLVAYTNVSEYLFWIRHNAAIVYCI